MEQNWVTGVLENLAASNETGQQTAEYLINNRVRISARRISRAAGAIWTLSGNIVLNAHYYGEGTPQNNARLLSILVHEVRHLQQGPVIALSVYGELDAWQVDFNFQKSITGEYPSQFVAQLCDLPLIMDRSVLKQARTLMQQQAGKAYRIDLLPLYPINQEVAYWLGWR